MLFNSYYFVLMFLPIVLALYYLSLRIVGSSEENKQVKYHKLSLWVLIISSFIFYAYDNLYYLILLLASILINWCIAWILNNKSNTKPVLVFGILIDVGIIFYFKYYDFFISNINSIFKADFTLKNIILPLGISFFTFQQISYLVDTYKGETKDYGFTEYVAFVSFFPQLVAGPIVLHSELITQYRDRSRWSFNSASFAKGLYTFALGLVKKVIIADKFGQVVTFAWSDIATRSSVDMLLASIFYTFQIYFDFSGYCDMAIGIAGMFNLELPVNFNSPYKATSISDFWKRWHMTLTRFLTRYIYIPLGGNRKGKLRTYINILIVFLVSGIWHGANWTFILWGLLHGILQVLNRIFKSIWDRVPKAVAWVCTFMTVNILWILFYASSVSEFGLVLSKIFAFDSLSITPMIEQLFVMNEIQMVLNMLGPIGAFMTAHMGIYMWTYIIIAFVIVLIPKNLHEKEFRPTTSKAILSALLMIWAVISFKGVSTFLYFNF